MLLCHAPGADWRRERDHVLSVRIRGEWSVVNAHVCVCGLRRAAFRVCVVRAHMDVVAACFVVRARCVDGPRPHGRLTTPSAAPCRVFGAFLRRMVSCIV